MKKIILLLFISAQLVFVSAQPYQINLQVSSFSEGDFAPFIFSNDLSGAPRIFAVTISPEEGDVKVRGEIFWKKDDNSGFDWLMTFRTRVFTARSFFNTDLGNAIPLGRGESDDNLIDENRKRGRPSGQYRLDIYLLDENDQQLAFDTKTYEFSNPAQTLSINLPQAGSMENIGGVHAEWTELTGIQYYEIKANVRENSSQSLEEALNSGSPIIDNMSVGIINSVDLRTILSREWTPGQEIVFRVAAIPIGGSPSNMKQSNIVNFYLDDPANPFRDATSETINQLLQALSDGIGNELLDRLLNGNLLINEISWEETGISLTPQEIQELLNYLRQHPDNIVNIQQD